VGKLLAIVGVATALVVAPPVAAQVPAQDSVVGEGVALSGFFVDIQIDARSGPGGENPTGTAFLTVFRGATVVAP
jgi:hypothetical protein